MKNENNETIEDIVRELRSEPLAEFGAKPWLHYLADRIESAAKRERESGAEMAQICGEIGEAIGREATCRNSLQVGNVAAMREALEKTKSVIATCMEILNKIPDGCDYDGLVDEVADELCDLRDSHVKSAISAPPRNCDLLSDAQEALAAIHEDRGYVNNPIDERRLTVNWLFDEAKGDEK